MTNVLVMVAALAPAIALAGCGGGGDGPDGPSGVDPALTVQQLDPDDTYTLCDWMIDAQGGPGTTQTCDGLTVRTNTVEQCVESFNGISCGVTVGEIEDCLFAIDGDNCGLLNDPACEVLYECI